MAFRIPDKYRIRHAERLLDWAEKKPESRRRSVTAAKFQTLRRRKTIFPLLKVARKLMRAITSLKLVRDYRYSVSSLQSTRRHQRRSAEGVYERTRPPEGTEIEYLFFRLFEMFHIEDFERLKNNLLKLLPGLESDFPHANFKTEFQRSAEAGGAGGWRKLGIITREGEPFPLEPSRVMPELPEEVKGIFVELHQILPSIFTVTLDIHLTEKATAQLVSLQSQRFLPRVRYKKLIPLGKFGLGRSEENAATVMNEEILEWHERLRGKVEACFRPYLEGYFMRSPADGASRLPAIEVYAFKGLPEGDEAFAEWKERAYHWWRSLGFNFHAYDYYKTNNLLFAWAKDRETTNSPSHRFVALWEPSLRSVDVKSLDSNHEDELVEELKDGAVKEDLADALTEMLPGIAILRLCSVIRNNVEKFKHVALATIASSRRMKKYIALNYVVQREAMLLNRVELEFKEAKDWFEGSVFAKLKSARKPTEEGKDHNLRDDALREIEWDIKQIKEQLDYIASSFSGYLSTRNMEAMYRLQWRIFWFTVIVTIATIIGVVATVWQQ